MRKAFTLIELLTVMMIMGLMGTAAIGGYRAMQRGMEERGVMQNANAVIRATYQRAQIDRQPTAIFFWNETLRGATADENEVVVGRAVAVRRHGRLTNVIGSNLVDEFGDLNLAYPLSDDEDDEDSGSASSAKDLMYLYPLDNLSAIAGGGSLKRSQVRTRIANADERLLFLTGSKSSTGGGEDDADANVVPAYAFEMEESGGVQWKPGMAYGFEFARLELPVGYIFGTDYSRSADNPIRPAGTLVFKPGRNSGGGLNTGGIVGRNSIAIYSLRPSGTSLQAQSIGNTDSPDREM